jgi:hypothetical protein
MYIELAPVVVALPSGRGSELAFGKATPRAAHSWDPDEQPATQERR